MEINKAKSSDRFGSPVARQCDGHRGAAVGSPGTKQRHQDFMSQTARECAGQAAFCRAKELPDMTQQD
jgi:hypothetical protein